MAGTLLTPRAAVRLYERLATFPAAAGTFLGEEFAITPGAFSLTVQSKLTYTSGGTSAKVYVQTSFDNGVTWVDVMCHAFTTATASKISSVRTTTAVAAAYVPTDGSLSDDTIKDGLLGDRCRVKLVVTGTYNASNSLSVWGIVN